MDVRAALKSWIDRGFLRDILLAIPPNAPLSPYSKLPSSALGKTPGRFSVDGWLGQHDWPSHITTLDELKSQLKLLGDRPFNVALNSRHLHALDFDTDDPDLARWWFDNLVTEEPAMVAASGVRFGKPPHWLITFKPEGQALRKSRLSYRRGEEKSAIELLGVGQQYLVAGQHPCGRAYTWVPWSPGVSFDDLLTQLPSVP